MDNHDCSFSVASKLLQACQDTDCWVRTAHLSWLDLTISSPSPVWEGGSMTDPFPHLGHLNQLTREKPVGECHPLLHRLWSCLSHHNQMNNPRVFCKKWISTNVTLIIPFWFIYVGLKSFILLSLSRRITSFSLNINSINTRQIGPYLFTKIPSRQQETKFLFLKMWN